MKKLNDQAILEIADKLEQETDFENLFKEEKGHADLFVSYYRESIKLLSTAEGYYFDQFLNLWTEKTRDDFVKMVTNFLDNHICNILKDLASDKKRAEKFYELTKILKKVRGVKHCDNVWKFVAPDLVDKNFKQKLNKIPNLLPISKGRAIDLKTLEIRLRKKTDYFDFELPYDFTPKKISKAEKFFAQIMNNNKEVVTYLQTILGYCLTGETDMRSMFIFWGSGSNGKSTLCELLKKILDKFYITADKKIFIKQERGSAHTAHLMPLVNARLAVLSETEEGEKLNESLIKALTGNDSISARELYGKQFSFKPVAKYVMLTNHKPTFNINDQALLDRIRYIPFNARFTSKPKKGEFLKDCRFIDNLMNKYLDEVFSWLCIGSNNYYKLNGDIDIPKSLQDATDDYIKEIDNISQFIADKCKRKEDSKVSRTELYSKYKDYCCDNGFVYQRNTDFYKRLDNLGFEQAMIMGNRCIKGLELINYLE
jgi:P4 family phage/plasmid primase-like protien